MTESTVHENVTLWVYSYMFYCRNEIKVRLKLKMERSKGSGENLRFYFSSKFKNNFLHDQSIIRSVMAPPGVHKENFLNKINFFHFNIKLDQKLCPSLKYNFIYYRNLLKIQDSFQFKIKYTSRFLGNFTNMYKHRKYSYYCIKKGIWPRCRWTRCADV